VSHAKQTVQLFDARGRALIERRGGRRSSLGNDAYHFLRTAGWPRILGLFAAFFALSNLIFAAVLYVGGAHVVNGHGFADDFWFSVQTMATIGYGYLAPGDTFANSIVMVESFFGILLTALITGIVFSRFSRPSARVLFSKVALIAEHDGRRAFMIRIVNERATAIVEATVRLYLTREEKLANGDTMRRIYDIPLRRATSPVFALSFLVVHVIDDASPFAKMTAIELRETNANIVATFTGIDDGLAETVHSRYVWTWNEIVFDHRFADMLKVDPDGTRYLDLDPFHEVVPHHAPIRDAAAT
jgi:inward rectifier potassium channel